MANSPRVGARARAWGTLETNEARCLFRLLLPYPALSHSAVVAWNKRSLDQVLRANDARKRPMRTFDQHPRQNSDQQPAGLEAITWRGGGENVIYILVIGLTGAIFSNAIILLGFILLASAK